MFGIDDAVAAGLKVLDKFIPDPAVKQAAEAELRASLQAWDKMQTDVNKAEAENASLFVAGWRPAIGWSCAFAFGFIYVAAPMIAWLGSIAGFALPQPKFDVDALMSLTFGMLGMAGFRTFEKVKGVARG
jgi:hypothetical protein